MKSKNPIELIQKWNTAWLMARIRGDKQTEEKALNYQIRYLRRYLQELHLDKVLKLTKEQQTK